MATTTLNFTANAATIRISGYKGGGTSEFSNTTNNQDPVVRMIAAEYAANQTESGTVTVTAT